MLHRSANSIGSLVVLTFMSGSSYGLASPASDSLCLHARSLLRMGRARQAKLYFDRAIELDPGSLTPYLGRAQAFTDLEDRSHAMEDINFILKRSSNSVAAYRLRSRINYENGKLPEATDDISKALLLDNTVRDKSDDYMIRATYYRDEGKMDKALTDLSLAVKLEPGVHFAYVDRGALYYALGKYRESADDYTKAIKFSNPKDRHDILRYHANRAKCYEKMGRPDLAAPDEKMVNSETKESYGSFFPGEKK